MLIFRNPKILTLKSWLESLRGSVTTQIDVPHQDVQGSTCWDFANFHIAILEIFRYTTDHLLCVCFMGFLEDTGLTSPITRVYWSNTALRISSNLKSWPEMTRCWKKETLDFLEGEIFFELIVSMFVPLCKAILEKKVGKRKGEMQYNLSSQHSIPAIPATLRRCCTCVSLRLGDCLKMFDACLVQSLKRPVAEPFERCNCISWWKH